VWMMMMVVLSSVLKPTTTPCWRSCCPLLLIAGASLGSLCGYVCVCGRVVCVVLSCLCQCFKSGQQQQDSWPFGRTKRCFEPGTAQMMKAPLCWGMFLCVVGKPKGFCVGQWSSKRQATWVDNIIRTTLPFHCPGSHCYVTPLFRETRALFSTVAGPVYFLHYQFLLLRDTRGWRSDV